MKNEPLDEYKPKLDLKPLSQESQKEFKKVCCPSCEQNVSASNMNIDKLVAKCNQCDIIFPFGEEMASRISDTKLTQEIFRPEGIEINHFKGELDISIKQPFTPIEWVGMLLLPLGVLAFFDFVDNPPGQGIPWVLITLGLLFLAFIVNLIIRSNHRVYLSIDDQYITRMYRPKKLMKDKTFEVEDIVQLYVKKGDSYGVYMILDAPEGQKHVPLLKGLDTLSKAKYLEQQIEKHLGLTDKPV